MTADLDQKAREEGMGVGGRLKAALLEALIAGVRALPWRLRRRLAEAIGRSVAGGKQHRMVAALANLELAFGSDMAPARKEEVARASFESFARCMLDATAMVPKLTADTWDRTVKVPEADLTRMRGYLAEGKGALVMFAHYGNWELMGAAMAYMDLAPINVVARRQEKWLNPFIERLRTATGNQVIYKEGAARKTLSALKRGEIVGLAIDQNFSRGVFVPFFGVEAGTPDTLAALARASGAPIVPLACYPNDDGTYTGRLLPAVETVKTSDKATDILENTRRCLEVLEELIRDRPELWLWSHKRWKSRPPDEEPKRDIYATASAGR